MNVSGSTEGRGVGGWGLGGVGTGRGGGRVELASVLFDNTLNVNKK